MCQDIDLGTSGPIVDYVLIIVAGLLTTQLVTAKNFASLHF